MQQIESRSNPKIKQLAKLLSDKKERTRQGVFVCEGVKLAKEAFLSGLVIESLFFVEEQEESLRAEISAAGEVYRIAKEVADKVSDQKNPQGVFCVCRSKEEQIPPFENGILLALDGIRDPGNLGTLIRTAEAMGIHGILLSSDCCDVHSPKVIRAAMGSVFRLPMQTAPSLTESLFCYKEEGFTVLGAVPDQKAENILTIPPLKREIIVIGNESNGLSKEVIDCCDTLVTIEMKGNTESLNAAAAAVILLWERSKYSRE